MWVHVWQMYMHGTLRSYHSIIPPSWVLLPGHPQTENILECLPSFAIIYAVLWALEGQYEELGYCHRKRPVVQDLHSEYTHELIFLGTNISNLTSNKFINNFKCFPFFFSQLQHINFGPFIEVWFLSHNLINICIEKLPNCKLYSIRCFFQ